MLGFPCLWSSFFSLTYHRQWPARLLPLVPRRSKSQLLKDAVSPASVRSRLSLLPLPLMAARVWVWPSGDHRFLFFLVPRQLHSPCLCPRCHSYRRQRKLETPHGLRFPCLRSRLLGAIGQSTTKGMSVARPLSRLRTGDSMSWMWEVSAWPDSSHSSHLSLGSATSAIPRTETASAAAATVGAGATPARTATSESTRPQVCSSSLCRSHPSFLCYSLSMAQRLPLVSTS